MSRGDTSGRRGLDIAVNARFLLPGDSLEGIGRFTNEVMSRVVRDHPEHTFHFLFDRAYDSRYLFGPNVVPHVVHPPARHPILYVAWFEIAVSLWLRRHRPDAFVSTDGHTTLSTNVPRVTVMHDLAFEHSTGDVGWLQERYYRLFFRRFAAASERLAAVSDATRLDIAATYGIAASTISVIPNAADEHFLPTSDEEGDEKLRGRLTGGRPYFLFVGAVQPRKNVVNLLRAFDAFKQSDNSGTRLLVAGRAAWRTGATERTYAAMKHRESVCMTGRVSDDELLALYRGALALVYVPFFEGFGIPIVEAQSCGCPVVTSNVSSLPEVAGNAAVLVNPHSIADIAASLRSLSTDESERARLTELGFANAQRFSWSASAATLWNEIERAASRRNGSAPHGDAS